VTRDSHPRLGGCIQDRTAQQRNESYWGWDVGEVPVEKERLRGGRGKSSRRSLSTGTENVVGRNLIELSQSGEIMGGGGGDKKTVVAI